MPAALPSLRAARMPVMARGARPVLPRPCHMRPVVPACGVPGGAKRPWCPPERAAKLRRARPYQSRRVVPIWPVPSGPSARGANLARARESGLVVQRAAFPSPCRPTTRATDAAGAALTWARLFGVVVCFHFSSSRRRSAADADVGRLTLAFHRTLRLSGTCTSSTKLLSYYVSRLAS